MASDENHDPLFERAAAELRRPSARDEASLDELIAALRSPVLGAGAALRVDVSDGDAAASRRRRRERRPFFARDAVRYVAGLAAGIAFAAGLGLGIFTGWRMRGVAHEIATRDSASHRSFAAYPARLAEGPRLVEFMLVAPAASRVSLVGEFNGWDPHATPMQLATGGAWRVSLPLPHGRHVYAFVVDGSEWVPDPQAPLAPERWYGARNSVLLISGGS